MYDGSRGLLVERACDGANRWHRARAGALALGVAALVLLSLPVAARGGPLPDLNELAGGVMNGVGTGLSEAVGGTTPPAPPATPAIPAPVPAAPPSLSAPAAPAAAPRTSQEPGTASTLAPGAGYGPAPAAVPGPAGRATREPGPASRADTAPRPRASQLAGAAQSGSGQSEGGAGFGDDAASGGTAAAAASPSEDSTAAVTGPRADELPFTGAELLALAGLGLLILAGGLALRRVGVARPLRPGRG